MNVYQLFFESEPDGNCKYRHFGPLDSCHPEILRAARLEWFRGKTMSNEWHPLEIEPGEGTEHLELPDFDATPLWHMFSHRAVDALADILEPNGELLPVIYPECEYYAYNCLTLADVVDSEKCDPIYDNFRKLIFRKDALDGLTIFVMKDCPWVDLLVTDTFVERVKQSNLKGFGFIKRPTV
ncbi:MAG: hypothetical protein HC810_01410 [Acaryochloridaceae cyanobacterium RL_2_7]|nr:hypothetical protein [Acaryochloridaceae cyanobacterium RL_2_7]